MNDLNWINVALSFLGGFGLFLFGMEYMGEGLQKSAGSKMKNLLGALTSNPFIGVLVGAVVTAMIQSSSATTVMVVGFVNAGLMSLKQAVGVIMGANIGTTVTAWIVSLGEWTSFLKPAVLAPICIIAGVLMTTLFERDEKKIQEVFEREKTINQLQHGINHYLIKLSNATLSNKEHEEVTKLFHIVSDIERIGDHAENIAELAQNLMNQEEKFSDKAQNELKEITDVAIESFALVLKAHELKDAKIANKVMSLEEQVDSMEAKLRSKHMKRLVDNTCNPLAGIIFLDTISNIERVSDHASNIALTVVNERNLLTTEDMNLSIAGY